ncbi:MAG: hypothetical protein NUV68_02295 [Caldiserica bacterium]|nr:hypothetical protein [Caldisericota bacterium]MDH7562189.1 hypothetical protein [Caldisericota bacterium]
MGGQFVVLPGDRLIPGFKARPSLDRGFKVLALIHLRTGVDPRKVRATFGIL